MATTLDDIARIAEVNKTTVSKALRGSSDISKETKRRILAIADQLGYTGPVSRKASKTVAILCPEFISHYYAAMSTALSDQLYSKGYISLLMLTNFSKEREKILLKKIAAMRVSGIVCITEQDDISHALHEALDGLNIPVVVMGLNYQSSDYDVISVDEQIGITQAVEHLISLGHTEFAFIGDEYANQRLEYFTNALGAKGIELDKSYIFVGSERHELCGYNLMKQLLSRQPLPTAVIAEYDAIALGAYRAIHEAGLRIPDDISLTGFDNTDYCRYLPVSLTSIDSKIADMCRISVAILINKITDPGYDTIQTVAIKPELVIRESTSSLVSPQ